MDSNLFMGLLIGASAVLLGIATGIATLIIKPIINLNRNIADLNSSVKSLSKSVDTIDVRLAKHGQEIDAIKDDLREYEGRISRIEGGKHK